MATRLPTDDEVARLKRELNTILWTDDPPDVPKDLVIFDRKDLEIEKGSINTNCTCHSIVVGALLMRRGARVTTRGGMAFLIVPSPTGNPLDDCLHQIAKHWWITTDRYGVVDLSLHLHPEPPLVYLNRSVGSDWPVSFGDTREKLDQFIRARKRGIFYFTVNKKFCTAADFEQSLEQAFPPAKNHGITLKYRHIVDYCSVITSTPSKFQSFTDPGSELSIGSEMTDGALGLIARMVSISRSLCVA